MGRRKWEGNAEINRKVERERQTDRKIREVRRLMEGVGGGR